MKPTLLTILCYSSDSLPEVEKGRIMDALKNKTTALNLTDDAQHGVPIKENNAQGGGEEGFFD